MPPLDFFLDGSGKHDVVGWRERSGITNGSSLVRAPARRNRSMRCGSVGVFFGVNGASFLSISRRSGL